MQDILNEQLNNSNLSIDQIFELLQEENISELRIWGINLENLYKLFELDNSTFVIAKNCQSVYGWHVLSFYTSLEDAEKDWHEWVKDDYENNAQIELMIDGIIKNDDELTKEELLEDD